MKNFVNNRNYANLLGVFFQILGIGLFSFCLFWFGEYLADYHMTGTMNLYCTVALTICVYFGLKGFIRETKRQRIYQKNMKRIKDIDRKALLDFHPHHHEPKYWI